MTWRQASAPPPSCLETRPSPSSRHSAPPSSVRSLRPGARGPRPLTPLTPAAQRPPPAGGLAAAGSAAGLGVPYYASLCAAGGHLAWQVWSVDLDNPGDCMAKFVSNTQLGGVLMGGVVLGKLFALP